MLEKKVLDSITLTLTTIKETPGFELYWSLRKKLVYPKYRQFIDALMYQSEYQASPSYTGSPPGGDSRPRVTNQFLRVGAFCHFVCLPASAGLDGVSLGKPAPRSSVSKNLIEEFSIAFVTNKFRVSE